MKTADKTIRFTSTKPLDQQACYQPDSVHTINGRKKLKLKNTKRSART